MARRPCKLAVLLLLFTSPAALAKTWDVKMVGVQFVPAKLTVKVGDTVRWTNEDIVPHSVTKDPKNAAGLSGVVNPGQSWERKMKKPGLFRYACGLHPTMKAEIQVKR